MRKLLFITISILFITSCVSESGCIQGDCQNQISIYVWESGDIYEGGFVDGHFHGQGTTTFSDGSSYVGEYKDGKRNGQGTQTFSDGSSYVGEYKKGKSMVGVLMCMKMGILGQVNGIKMTKEKDTLTRIIIIILKILLVILNLQQLG